MDRILLRTLIQLCLITLSLSSTQDFVSIDCGSDGSYTDALTTISYTSDNQYIDTGVNYNITSNYPDNSILQRQVETVRSFPFGVRNCYTFNTVMEGNQYLIRAAFLYGNYDKQESVEANKSLQFDLHIGSNYWRSVNISEASAEYIFEVITVALADILWVCLVNTGHGTPFISSLELRPLKKNLYPHALANQSNAFLFRYNYGPTTDEIIRYPDDPYDRIWKPYSYDETIWTEVSTNATIETEGVWGYFSPPDAVIRTAASGISNHSVNLTVIQWYPEAGSLDSYGAVLYFSEIQKLGPNESRQFNVYMNDDMWVSALTPPYSRITEEYSTTVFYQSSSYVFTLGALENSTLPPLINALEIYSVLNMPNPVTYIDDVDAIMVIKQKYQVKKNWMGDPCNPTDFTWSGLVCNYSTVPSRIVSINLSYSGLAGTIADGFKSFQKLESLDLSYNNLTGEIPSFLASMQSLQILSLEGNHFTGQVPGVLTNKKNAGLLDLDADKCRIACGTRKFSIFAITTIILGCTIFLLLLAFIVIWRRHIITDKNMHINNSIQQFREDSSNQLMDSQGNILQIEGQQFSYGELQMITSKFVQIIGRGGFGTVYHGLHNGLEVAVKVLSISSPQGNREFYAEVRHLSRVHHKNLLSLVGYCKDGSFMALVYSFMSGGNLHDYLRGKATRILNMEERLQILLEASQGLEYLHTACEPPIIHRDVKTTNILLNQKLEAKISDFGLSKVFQNDICTHISTSVAGTPGYLDPEYQSTYQLNEKSDVYSFGVVILEVLTAQPPIISTPMNVHISEWVRRRLAQGGLSMVIDVKLHDMYDAIYTTKIIDLALLCTMQTSAQRPLMSYVVSTLKECKEMGIMGRKKRKESERGGSSTTQRTECVRTQSGELILSDVPSGR